MHIPDGYLSPLMSGGLGIATVPAWTVASQRVKRVLDDRTIPLLAIFSALSFTVMLFNIPVLGGTTAHGVGGTLIAVVLGPWAAVIAVSTALVIQALFFGDGGVLAIFANCLNMAILLPLVGYATYRLLAGRAPMLSRRRALAAAIGAYAGITASALAVGVELGVQPLLFSQNGHALYSPYGLAEAVPAMLAAHAFGASIVEAALTGLGVVYLQRRLPEHLLQAPGAASADPLGDVPETRGAILRPVAATLAVVAVALLAAGLVGGGGDPARLFGADWRAVDWSAVVALLATVALVAALGLPLAHALLPDRIKRVGTAFAALAVLAPFGLIAPGYAFGEGTASDVGRSFGYVPKGLGELSSAFSAPLSGYELPFLSHRGAALWQAGIGYELAGIVGMVAIALASLGLARLLARRPRGRTEGAAVDGRIGWLEKSIGGVTGSIEQAVFTERYARLPGWLQRRDPRAKLVGFLLIIVAVNLSSSLAALGLTYLVVLGVARASRIPFDFFVKRVWLGIPLFAGIVVLPAIFFWPAPRVFDLGLGPLHLAPSWAGLTGAVLFVARVGVSVSLAVLLVTTTRWADILKALRALGVPQVFVLVLAMTYRYVFLFLHTANGMLLARKSRTVGRTGAGEQRRWVVGSMGALMSRAFKMSNDVYAAMVARGFGGELRTHDRFRIRAADWTGLAAAVAVSVACLVVGRLAP